MNAAAVHCGRYVRNIFFKLSREAIAIRGGSARYVRGRFLTRNEKDFLAVLDEALGSNYRVFVQVRLAELVE